ncbi:MAG: RsmE family RNA methyltransferase [Elusimicrobiota bacterium]|nr:RsmE family RNA methyltransferase [Elusimicrobiota bacterium]
MTQFYAPSINGEISGDEAHHLVNVRRFKQGDLITIFDGKGRSARVRIKNILKNPVRVETSVLEKHRAKAPEKEIRLFLSVIKSPALKIAVQKCTELGVTRISPLRTKRSARQAVNNAQLQKIILNACGQCGRLFLPSLDEVKDFLIGIKEYSQDNAAGFILLEGGRPLKIREQTQKTAIFAGPEGGFTDSEIDSAEKAGLAPVSVGANTLRSETAVIAALVLTGTG